MPISRVGIGSISTGTTSLTPGIPSGSVGDLLVLHVANKHTPNGPDAVSGWDQREQASGGLGTSGIDRGSMYCTVYTREADGTEGATVSVSVPSANVSQAYVLRYSKDSSEGWNIGATKGAFDDPALFRGAGGQTITLEGNPGLTAGDYALAFGGINTDGQSVMASQAMAATGISAWGTVTGLYRTNTATGNDQSIYASEHPVSAGTATAAPTYTAASNTGASATADAPTGPVVVLRIRAVPSAAPPAGTTTIDSVTPSDTSAVVVYSYDDVDDTGFDYRIDGGTAASIGESPATITGLTANTEYDSPGVEVRATNGAGAGTWSDPVAFGTDNPAEGGGGEEAAPVEVTATSSLSAALQIARSASASIAAAIQSQRSATAAIAAAIQSPESLAASLAAAIQDEAAVTASLSAGIQAPASATASLAAAVQVSDAATASLSAALQDQGTVSADLAAAIQAARTATASLSAQLQAGFSASATIDAALQTPESVTSSLSLAAMVSDSATADLSAALQAARTASAFLSAFVQGAAGISASLAAAIQQAQTATASLSAAISVRLSQSASIAAALAVRNAATSSLAASVLGRASRSAALSLFIFNPQAETPANIPPSRRARLAFSGTGSRPAQTSGSRRPRQK